MSAPEALEALVSRLRESTADPGLGWLTSGLDAVLGGQEGRAFEQFPAVARQLGRGPLATEGSPTLSGPDDEVPLAPWTTDVGGRAALLLAVAAGSPSALPELLRRVYDEGDTTERIAVVRSLSLLPDGGRFVETALDAGRTNDTTLFEALACDNPFAARHYPDPELNKLVMKVAFVGLEVDRIVRLDDRGNPELARMGMEYIDEQESASRPFAPAIWLAIAPHPPPGAVGRMLGYLSHSVEPQRYWAARGLARVAQSRARDFLVERREVEQSPRARTAITEAITAVDRRHSASEPS